MLLFLHLALAAGGGGAEGAPSPDFVKLGLTAVSLLLFLGILYAVARKPISEAISGRAALIRGGLDEAARLTAESQARFADVEARLLALDGEIEEMRRDAREDAEREAAVLRARGEAEAVRIQETAERAIREEVARAKDEIRKEAVSLAVSLAKATLSRNTSRDDQERLAREFLDAVGRDRGGVQ